MGQQGVARTGDRDARSLCAVSVPCSLSSFGATLVSNLLIALLASLLFPCLLIVLESLKFSLFPLVCSAWLDRKHENRAAFYRRIFTWVNAGEGGQDHPCVATWHTRVVCLMPSISSLCFPVCCFCLPLSLFLFVLPVCVADGFVHRSYVFNQRLAARYAANKILVQVRAHRQSTWTGAQRRSSHACVCAR